MRKAFTAGQRMAAARGWLVRLCGLHLTVGIRRTVTGTQVLLQVRVDRSGDVCLLILLAACSRCAQVKAAVKHHEGLTAGLQGLQLCGGNQCGVSHGLA